jgi:hypothetical protein
MIDVRGGSVFSAGMNSKYNAFFSMPYPLIKKKPIIVLNLGIIYVVS